VAIAKWEIFAVSGIEVLADMKLSVASDLQTWAAGCHRRYPLVVIVISDVVFRFLWCLLILFTFGVLLCNGMWQTFSCRSDRAPFFWSACVCLWNDNV